MLKRLLILGPSFRRNERSQELSAIERYDGVYFRVARRHLPQTQGVNVIVMIDDLSLIDSKSPLPHIPAKGSSWGKQSFPRDVLEEARKKNEAFLRQELASRKYGEVFVAMGKKHARALPDLTNFGVKAIFPTEGGLGPKAKALKEWILG